MRPDVALVAPYPPAGQRHGGHSGVASYTANLAHALADEGVDVTVIAAHVPGATDEPDEFHDGAVRIVRRYHLGARALPDAAKAVADLGPRVTHLQWELFLYGGPRSVPGLLPALATLRRAGTGLVTTMHQVLDPRTIDRSATALHRIGAPAPIARIGLASVQRSIAAACDVTIVHERAFTSIVPGSTMIPHGVELPRAIDRSTARSQLQLDDRFIALCFGFLAPYKGLELAADAAALTGPAVDVVFAGGAHPRLDGVYDRELHARSGGRAHFTGWVPDEDVAAWFGAADVALFTYPKPFSASGALALALAHRTPIMLSPALARCIGAPSTVVTPMDPASLAAELDRLAADPDAVGVHADWTGALRQEREWPAVARRHIEVYEEVRRGTHPDARRVRAA
jgi:glycosyltransferase involved in cell wall biosynthesis